MITKDERSVLIQQLKDTNSVLRYLNSEINRHLDIKSKLTQELTKEDSNVKTF